MLKGLIRKKLWNMTEKNQKHYSVCALDHGAVKERLLIRREVLKAIVDVEKKKILHAWNLKEKHDYEMDEMLYLKKIKKLRCSSGGWDESKGCIWESVMTVFFHSFSYFRFDGFGNLFGRTLGDDEGL